MHLIAPKSGLAGHTLTGWNTSYGLGVKTQGSFTSHCFMYTGFVTGHFQHGRDAVVTVAILLCLIGSNYVIDLILVLIMY